MCDSLLEVTLSDPKRREHATYGKVTPEGKLMVKKGVIVGEETHVNTNIRLKQGVVTSIAEVYSPQYRSNEYHALGIHTHGIVQKPPSLADVSNLLRTTEEGGSQSEVILTQDTRYLLIRSLETPDMSGPEIEAWIAKKKGSVVMDLSKNVEGYLSFMKQRGIPVSTEALQSYQGRADTEAQMRLLYEVCLEMNIELRVATGNSNNYTKENATAMAKLVGIDGK